MAAPLRRMAKQLVRVHQPDFPILSRSCRAPKRPFSRRIAEGRGKSVAPPGEGEVAAATPRFPAKKRVVPLATSASTNEKEVVPLAAVLKPLDRKLARVAAAKQKPAQATRRRHPSFGNEIQQVTAGTNEFFVNEAVVAAANCGPAASEAAVTGASTVLWAENRDTAVGQPAQRCARQLARKASTSTRKRWLVGPKTWWALK